MRHAVALLVALCLVLPAALASSPNSAAAQATGRDRLEAAEMARHLSRLEAAREFDAIYDLIHPDAAVVVPREAVVGWYREAFAHKTTAPLTVTGVEFGAWTWGVTGQTYPYTATVAFVQPYVQDGVRTEQAGAVHLVKSAGTWRWFFGSDPTFVNQQIARFVAAASSFPNILDADIDRFWSRTFAAADRVYEPPAGIVGFTHAITTGCGLAEPGFHVAFYCTADATIYYDAAFRSWIEQQVGDFAWVTVVAHEWGHHIQVGMGIYASQDPEVDGGLYTIDVELQADCLAGAYAGDAETRAWLDPGDMEEAVGLTHAAGDAPGTAWNDPLAHGTSEQRVTAFHNGYGGGVAGCGLEL